MNANEFSSYFEKESVTPLNSIQTVKDSRTASGTRRVAPGLVDIQVNGFGGVDFNDSAITFDAYTLALRKLYEHRVTCALPTLVTNAPDVLEEQLKRLESYRETLKNAKNAPAETVPDSGKIASCEKTASAPFYHLEGPFISQEEGYRGAHPLKFVLSTDDWRQAERWISAWQKAANGRIRIMTFSPHGEKNSVSEFIQVLKSYDILPAVGHTHAAAVQIRAAVQAGAVLATHLGNACAQLLPRHANPIWTLLSEDSVSISMIGDGFHLPPDMLKVFYQVKGAENTILISDATQYAGRTPGKYHTHIGGDVVLTPERKLHIEGQPNVLAGAAKSLWEGWKHVSKIGFISESACWFAASGAPLRLLTGNTFSSEFTPLVEVE